MACKMVAADGMVPPDSSVTPLTRKDGVVDTSSFVAAVRMAEMSAELKHEVKAALSMPSCSTPESRRFCEKAVLP